MGRRRGTEKTETKRFIFRGESVQQPFVAGRGEKFAFFVIFFSLPISPSLIPPDVPRIFSRFFLHF